MPVEISTHGAILKKLANRPADFPQAKLEREEAYCGGTITKEELEAAPSELALELASCFQTDDLNELFDLLDTERSGSVSWAIDKGTITVCTCNSFENRYFDKHL